MFKNLTLYRITNMPANFGPGSADACFSSFVPCGATQEKSVGWIPPRGHANGALLESVSGQWIMKLMVESKAVPTDVIKRKVAEQVAHIESTTGRKPGKKEKREITEDARISLLPMAFTKQVATLAWIDPETNLLAIDSASHGKLDEVVTALVKSLDGLSLTMISTTTAPASSMAQWLVEMEGPAGFSVDRECELKASDESKAVVKYGRHPLDIDEVAAHISQGKMPTRLAMTYNDRVSFVLTDAGALKKIAFLDSVFDTINVGMTLENDAFDVDVAIATGEIKKLIPDLFGALGGEVVFAETDKASVPMHLAGDGPDPLYESALALVRKENRAGISLVQRHLKIGYNRAARLIESMEKDGSITANGNGTYAIKS